MTRIVTTVHNPKRPPRKRKPAAPPSAAVVTPAPKQRAAPPADDTEVPAHVREWLDDQLAKYRPGGRRLMRQTCRYFVADTTTE